MCSGIIRSFFSRSPTVDRVGGSNGGRLGRKLNIKEKNENKRKNTKAT